jgi:hypothetical protein
MLCFATDGPLLLLLLARGFALICFALLCFASLCFASLLLLLRNRFSWQGPKLSTVRQLRPSENAGNNPERPEPR